MEFGPLFGNTQNNLETQLLCASKFFNILANSKKEQCPTYFSVVAWGFFGNWVGWDFGFDNICKFSDNICKLLLYKG